MIRPAIIWLICGVPLFAAPRPASATDTTDNVARVEPASVTAHIAVASNFLRTLNRIVEPFTARTGYTLLISAGSTGRLFAQIVNGAPFELFLAADADRPRRLVARHLGIAGSRTTYARGQLALWNGGHGDGKGNCLQTLKDGTFKRLAIANPQTAPYGLAARQTLEKLGRWQAVADKLVRGGNIAQTYQYVATGNAALAFVALSQLRGPGANRNGCRWLVPETMHAPIEQQVVLLNKGKGNAAARAFLAYLTGPEAGVIIRRFGYQSD